MEMGERNIWYAIVNATETERLNKRTSAEISDNEYAAATQSRTEVQERWCSYNTFISNIIWNGAFDLFKNK